MLKQLHGASQYNLCEVGIISYIPKDLSTERKKKIS